MKLKKGIVLTALMVGICGTSISSAFSDLPTSHWAYEKVKLMEEKEIINGFEDGTFKPDRFISREQFATILSKVVDEANITLPINEEVKSKAENCTDIKGRWSYEYIDKVFNMMGHSYSLDYKMYFDPERPMSREEVAKILVKVKGLDNEIPNYSILNKFLDKDDITEGVIESQKFKKYVAIAVEHGIMNGNTSGTFRPKGNLTRAQIAILMSDLLETERVKEFDYYAGDYSEGLIRVVSNFSYGFADDNNKIIIPCVYSNAEAFSEGLAAVCIQSYDSYFKYNWGYIDKDGNTVIPFIYDSANSFFNGKAEVEKDGRSFYIDKNGNEIASDLNEEVKEEKTIMYDQVFNFSEGMALVKKDNKYGYIDGNRNEVIPCIYETGEMFFEGMAAISKDGKYGFINQKGELVIPCIYDYAYKFSEGLAPVFKNGKCGYINIAGEEVIPFIYDDAKAFRGEYAVAVLEKYGCINKKGEIVIPFIYDMISGYPDSSGDLIGAQKDRKYGYINIKGETVIPFIYDWVDGTFSFGKSEVTQGDRKFYIDKEGNEIE